MHVGLGDAQRESLEHSREQALRRQPQDQVAELRKIGLQLVDPAVVLHKRRQPVDQLEQEGRVVAALPDLQQQL